MSTILVIVTLIIIISAISLFRFDPNAPLEDKCLKCGKTIYLNGSYTSKDRHCPSCWSQMK